VAQSRAAATAAEQAIDKRVFIPISGEKDKCPPEPRCSTRDGVTGHDGGEPAGTKWRHITISLKGKGNCFLG
jgi:hypothetical protein